MFVNLYKFRLELSNYDSFKKLYLAKNCRINPPQDVWEEFNFVTVFLIDAISSQKA